MRRRRTAQRHQLLDWAQPHHNPGATFQAVSSDAGTTPLPLRLDRGEHNKHSLTICTSDLPVPSHTTQSPDTEPKHDRPDNFMPFWSIRGKTQWLPSLFSPVCDARSRHNDYQGLDVLRAMFADYGLTQIEYRPRDIPLQLPRVLDDLLYRKHSRFFSDLPQPGPASLGTRSTIPKQGCQLHVSDKFNTVHMPVDTASDITTSTWSSRDQDVFVSHDTAIDRDLELGPNNATNLWRILLTPEHNPRVLVQDVDNTPSSAYAWPLDADNCAIAELDGREITYCHPNTLVGPDNNREVAQCSTTSEEVIWDSFVTAIKAMPDSATTDCLNELVIDHDIAPLDEAYGFYQAAPMPSPSFEDCLSDRQSQAMQDRVSYSARISTTASTRVNVDSDACSDLDASVFVLPSPVSTSPDQKADRTSIFDDPEDELWQWSDNDEAELDASMILVAGPYDLECLRTSDSGNATSRTSIERGEETDGFCSAAVAHDPAMIQLTDGGEGWLWYEMVVTPA